MYIHIHISILIYQHLQQHSQYSNGPTGSLEIVTDSPSLQLLKKIVKKVNFC